MKNGSGCSDPTAGKAIYRLRHIPEKIWEVIRIGRDFFHLAGLDVVEITVEDRKTKKKYIWKR